MRHLEALALSAAALTATPRPASADAFAWIEGEDSIDHGFNRHGWYTSSGLRMDVLSPGRPGLDPGDWLAHFSNDGADVAEATWQVSLTEDGPWTLWLRGNHYRTTLSLSVDGGPYEEIDLRDERGRVDLVDPGIDIRFLSWVRVGAFDLTAGEHSLRLRVDSHPAWDPPQVHAGVDALCLVNYPWVPAGALMPKPGGGPEPGPADLFPFVPTYDDPPEGSATDMTRLLHRPAGVHGALTRDEDALRFEDGTPVKLLGVGASIPPTAALQAQQARFLARHGVNIIRLHPVQSAIGHGMAELERLDGWFSALKEHGIYSAWSVFYPHVITPEDAYPADLYAELPDRGPGKSTSGYVGFMPALQESQWAWLRALLEHENPHTGLRYVDDPALAMLEVHNEDSLFWHAPLNTLAAGEEAPLHTAELQRLWMEWVRGRHGTDEALAAAWGAGLRDGDSVANPSMALHGAWEMEADGPTFGKEAAAARMGDFIRFLAETQRGFYERRGARLRELGFRGLRVATAWKAGGPAAHLANLHTDDALDAIDRHAYFGGGAGGHGIAVGDVRNGSHLATPGGGLLAAGLEQVEGKPFILTEWTSSPPNQWKAEALPLMALYGLGLQGWDGLFHFTLSRPRMGSGWPGESSYVSETPHYLGQFPAIALAVHRGDIAEAQLIAGRRFALDEVFSGFDARSLQEGGPAAAASLALGKATVAIGDGLEAPVRGPADTEASLLESTTGELSWDRAARVVVVSSPGTQGIIGFTDLRDTFDLPAATVVVESKFVSLLLSSLDQLPLRISRRILITAMARDAQKGAEYGIGGMTLDRLGGPPLMMEPVRASLTFKGEPVTEAAPLTTGGLRTGRALAREGNRITIDGRHATFYYEVIRGPAEEPAVDAGPGAEDAGRPPGPVSDAGQGEEVDAPPPAPDGAANEDAPTRPSAGGDSAGSGCGACSMAEGGPEWGWALWLLYPLVRRVPLLRSNRRWGRPSASPCRAGHPGPARLVTR